MENLELDSISLTSVDIEEAVKGLKSKSTADFDGEYSLDHLDRNGLKKYQQFGDLVREEIVPGLNLLFLYKPEDIEAMYEQDGKYPSRRSHTALEKYRKSNPELYNTGGLLPTNGPEWRRLRLGFQRSLGSAQSVRSYLPGVDAASKEFVDSIQEASVFPDFLTELSNAFLEFLGLVVFDVRLNAITGNCPYNSEPELVKRAAVETNQLVLRTDNGPQLWKFFPTPAYTKLSKAQHVFERIALKYIRLKKESLIEKGNRESTLLGSWLQSDDVDEKDVLAMVCDMLLAGIDTSAYTMGYVLYQLSMNPTVQDTLRDELSSVITGDIDDDALCRLPYLKACLKEAMRLHPISVGVGRIAANNMCIGGYEVPDGTVLVTQNQVSCRMEKYFSSPNSFKPERWVRGTPSYENVHPFLVLPFGHGARSCIARRLAEQNMYVLLARLVKCYRISWLGGELGCTSKLINKPDQPLRFKFSRV